MKFKLYTHEHCPACKRMEPIYEKLAKDYPMEIVDPTTDAGQEQAWKDNITSSPTLMILSDEGWTLNLILGLKRESEVWDIIERCKEME